MKKALISLFALALLLPVHTGFASNPEWETVEAVQTWDYGTYHVDRLKLPKIVEGPFNLGDAVVVQTVATTCVNAACDFRDAFVLRNGMTIRVPNVPRGALDPELYRANGNRVVWATPIDNTNDRFAIVELDLVSGTKTTLVDSFFMEAVTDMKVMVVGDLIFLNPTINFQGAPTPGVGNVFLYNPKSGKADVVTKRYVSQREELLDIDVANGRILTKMTFVSGESELWVTKFDTDRLNGEANRIIGTWTPSHEKIVNAHFRSNGSVDYFRMFAREVKTVNDKLETLESAFTDDYLAWNRPVENSVFSAGDQTVFVNTDSELVVSGNETSVSLGSVGINPVVYNDGSLFFQTIDGVGHVFDLATSESAMVKFTPTDRLGDAIVGVDPSGAIRYFNTKTKHYLSLGHGMSPALSDDSHVYWRGVDGTIFQTTITSLPKDLNGLQIAAVKTPASPTVFLTDGVSRWTIDNEDTYFSYFDEWNDVRVVSSNVVSRYRDRGMAQLPAGALVKSTDDARVYMIGRDGKAHWIANETVAFDAFGPTWNKTIVDIDRAAMNSYVLGDMLDSASDINRF